MFNLKENRLSLGAEDFSNVHVELRKMTTVQFLPFIYFPTVTER